MQSIEITAKSLEEATQRAAAQLNVATNQLVVEVLEQSKGLFGRGTVKIKATIEAAAPESVPEVQPATELPEVKTPELRKDPEPEPEPIEDAREPELTDESEAEPEQGDVTSVVASDKDAEFLVGRLQAFIEGADLDVRAEVRELNGKYVNIALDGKDSSFLVGKHGEVINALQYLLNIVSNQHLKNGVRASLDCNDYRRRREESLTKLATNIAVEVRNRGEEAVLDALPAFERRVVHKALQDFDGVTTYSEGEEPNRRVVIAPRD